MGSRRVPQAGLCHCSGAQVQQTPIFKGAASKLAPTLFPIIFLISRSPSKCALCPGGGDVSMSEDCLLPNTFEKTIRTKAS